MSHLNSKQHNLEMIKPLQEVDCLESTRNFELTCELRFDSESEDMIEASIPPTQKSPAFKEPQRVLKVAIDIQISNRQIICLEIHEGDSANELMKALRERPICRHLTNE